MGKRFLLTLVMAAGAANGAFIPAARAGEGDWLVRLRALHVSPNDDAGSVSGIPGSSVGVESDTTVELDFTYFLTRNLGVELILGSSQHDIKGKGSVGALGRIANTRTLPPTLTLQYHFMPDATVRPYAGIGVNYTKFYDINSSASLDNALGPTDVDLDSSWGVSGQLGVDMVFYRDWFINFDAKYIRMDTTATLDSGATRRKVDIDIDPWFLGVGVGTRF